MTDDERARAVELRLAGHTYAQIAAQIGKAPSTIAQALAGHVPPVHAIKAARVEEYRAQGLSWAEAAERAGYASVNSAAVAASRRRKRQRVLARELA